MYTVATKFIAGNNLFYY